MPHDVQTDATSTAPSMSHKELAQLAHVSRETAAIIGNRDSQSAVDFSHFEIDLGRSAVRYGVLHQICEHAFQSARVGHQHPIAALRNYQVRPMQTQRFNSIAQRYWFKKELSVRQVHQEQRVFQL